MSYTGTVFAYELMLVSAYGMKEIGIFRKSITMGET